MVKRKPVKGQFVYGDEPVYKQSMVVRSRPHTIYAMQPASEEDIGREPLSIKSKSGLSWVRIWSRQG